MAPSTSVPARSNDLSRHDSDSELEEEEEEEEEVEEYEEVEEEEEEKEDELEEAEEVEEEEVEEEEEVVEEEEEGEEYEEVEEEEEEEEQEEEEEEEQVEEIQKEEEVEEIQQKGKEVLASDQEANDEILQDVSQDMECEENEEKSVSQSVDMECEEDEVITVSHTVPLVSKDAALASPIVEDVGCNFRLPSPPLALLTTQGGNLVINDGESKSKNLGGGKESNVLGDVKNHVCEDERLDTKPLGSLSPGVGDNANMIPEQVKHTTVRSDNEIKQPDSRLRIRSASPAPELNNPNKRQAIVCDFFAKGWCIRGSSCKFLHVKNKASNSDGKAEGDSTVARSSKDQVNEGSTSTKPIGRLPDLAKQSFSSTRKDAITSRFSFDSQMAAQMGGKPILPSLPGEDLSSGIPHKSFRSLASNGAPVFPTPMKDVRTGWPPNEHGNGGNSFLLNNRLQPENRYSSSGLDLKSRLYNDKNPTSLFSSFDNSSHLRGVYMDDDCVGSTSGSGRKPSASCDDWEPSVPFQPSFLITPVKSSPAREYDPLRDSIDSPINIAKAFEFSFISNKVSTRKAAPNQPVKDDHFPSQTIGQEVNGERSSIPHHNRFHGSTSDNNKESFKHGPATDIDELADDQSGTMPKEEIASVSNHIDADQKPRSDGSRRMDGEGKMDQEVHKESKYPRHFRTALIGLVKELLKPAWREGHLSKDAHNTIVRKSSEKVLSTMQPHQVPTTPESIKHYLQSSRPKLEKLIEGYASRYAKS